MGCEGGNKTLIEIGRIYPKQGFICLVIRSGLFSSHEFNGECLWMMYEDRRVGKLCHITYGTEPFFTYYPSTAQGIFPFYMELEVS
jgi:hypothetical protein